MRRTQVVFLLTVGMLALAIAPTRVLATPINITNGGNVSISSLANLVGVTTVPNECINWAGGSTCSGNTLEPMQVTGGDSTVFSIPSTTAQIANLTGTAPVSPFETFAGGSGGAGTVTFSLQSITTPVGYSACTTTQTTGSCSTGTFIFTTESSTQVNVSFAASLLAWTGSSSTGTTAYSGNWSASVSGSSGVLDNTDATGACIGASVNIGALVSCEASGGGILSTWEGSEGPMSGTPEPAPIALLGMGLVGISLVLRRQIRRS